MVKNLIAVTISRNPETFSVPEIPFFNFSGDLDGYPIGDIAERYANAFGNREAKSSFEYLDYLARKRNKAVDLALQKYGDAEHIMVCDSYYVAQRQPLERLIQDYSEVTEKGYMVIVGGAVWGRKRTRISHLIRPPNFEGRAWYDKWGVPELRWAPFGWYPADDWLSFRVSVPKRGFYRVHCCSGIFIFPRSVWSNMARFSAPPDLSGVELKPFCEEANIPVYIDFDAWFWRQTYYSISKCIRCSLGLGRFLPNCYEWKKKDES